MISLRHPLPSLLLLALPSLASAQGLVQLRLDGATADRGTRVELEVGALVEKNRPRQIVVELFVGPGTTGGELGALLARRLSRAGFEVLSPEVYPHARSLFIERALFLRIRVGGGLTAVVTTCEGPPSAVRIIPPGRSDVPATVKISAGTFSLHTRDIGVAEIEVPIAPTDASPQISENLHKAATEAKWMADRPAGDSFRVYKMLDGSLILGCSVQVQSSAEWRLEVELPRQE